MKNNKGYAVHELIILSAIIGIIFGYFIMRISFAYEEASAKDIIFEEHKNALKVATDVYTKTHKDEFSETEDTYIFGKDLIDAGYLIQTEDFDYSKTKIKVTYNKDEKKYNIEVMD